MSETWEPITVDELKSLGKRIDSMVLICPDEDVLRLRLADYSDGKWSMPIYPMWIAGLLVAFLIKPREVGT